MAILCRDLNLLFIMVPGTGCSVVGQTLQKVYGGEKLGRKHNSIFEIVEQGLLTDEELNDLLIVATVRNPFDRFVTYYQRLVGEWTSRANALYLQQLEDRRGELSERELLDEKCRIEKKNRRRESRSRLIQKVGFNRWMKVTAIRWYVEGRSKKVRAYGLGARDIVFPMLERVDIAMRYEQLDQAFRSILGLTGVTEFTELPKKNITPGKRHYSEYYGKSTRRLIEILFRAELRNFDYRFEGSLNDNAVQRLSTRPLLVPKEG